MAMKLGHASDKTLIKLMSSSEELLKLYEMTQSNEHTKIDYDP